MGMAPAIVLEAWEHASRMAPVARSLALLALAHSNAGVEALSRLPLGRRDARLLELRRNLFGDRIECLTECPACRKELEFAVSAAGLLQQAGEDISEEYCLEEVSYRIRFRVPDTTDMLALAAMGKEMEAATLLPRCVIDIEGPDGPLAIADMPVELVRRVEKEMERRDPLAVIWLDLSCGHCGNAWRNLFDIAGMLWVDLDRWARELLRDIHLFARAYGWTERDVLALSAIRRESYLGMIGA